jgi:hypothetical protein
MPRSRTRHRRRSEAEWTEILRRFESSDLSPRRFCRGERLPLSSFQRWRRRLGPASPAEFVELVPTSAAPVSSEAWSLDIALPNGVRLRFRG